MAAVIFVLLMFWAFFFASLVGYSLHPRGPQRLAEHWYLLLTSILVGAGAVTGGLLVLRRRVLSPWLALAVLPALYFALVEGGWLP